MPSLFGSWGLEKYALMKATETEAIAPIREPMIPAIVGLFIR